MGSVSLCDSLCLFRLVTVPKFKMWLTWLLETRLVDTVFKNTPGSKPVLTRLLLRWTRIKGPRASEHSQLAGGDPR